MFFALMSMTAALNYAACSDPELRFDCKCRLLFVLKSAYEVILKNRTKFNATAIKTRKECKERKAK